MPSVLPRHELPLVVLAAILAAGLLFWPLPLHLTDALVTSPIAEGPDHVWRWWVSAQVGWPWGGHFDGLNHPDGLSVHVVDPLHALVARFFGWWWGGPAGGLAVVQVLGIVVGGVAGHQLAHESGGDRAGRWLGATVGMGVPTVVGAGLDGITEGLGLGWVGLQLAMVLRVLRTGRWRDAVLLGLALGAAAWTGPYNLVFAAMLDGAVGLWMLRSGPRALWGRLLGGGTLGLVLSSPVIWAAFSLTAMGPGGTGRRAAELPGGTLAWRGAGREGADVLDLFVPDLLTGAAADAPTTAYLGLVWLGVVGWGIWTAHQRGTLRAVVPWLVGAAGFAALALGPYLSLAGDPMTVGGRLLAGPAAMLEAVPLLGRLSRWYRAGAVAVLLLVPVGVHAVRGWRLGPVVLLGLVVLLDARLGSPVPFPSATVEVPVVDWTGVDGPLAEVPSVHPLGMPGQVADRNQLLQTLHGQSNSGTIDARGGAAADHRGLRILTRVLEGNPREGADVVGTSLQLLRDDGYRGLLVYPQALSPGGLALLTPVLGPPRILLPDVWYFPIPEGVGNAD